MYKNITKQPGEGLRLYQKIILVMRLTTVILLCSLLQVSAAGLAQRITLNRKNVPLEGVFKEIRKQAGYDYYYDGKLNREGIRVSVNVKDASVEETLQAVLKGLPLSYEVSDKYVVIKRKEVDSDPTRSKLVLTTIRGVVTDETGKPLAGVTVMVKGSNTGTVTDQDGTFTLKNVDDQGTLLVSMIGRETKQVNYKKNDDAFTIILKEINASLDEVKIVNKGYYNTTKETNTGNVSTVSATDIAKQNINNPILALAGRVAGLEINQVNGIAGGAVKINIRGINSLVQGTDPLFILDGVPYNSNLFNSSAYGGINGGVFGVGGGNSNQNLGLNPLSLINPQDIESIDILKDADATAIYGSRGANGVVLITTKKGKMGATSVDINIQRGYGGIARKTRLLNTDQYLQMRREAFANDNVTQTNSNGPDLTIWDQKAYTDWQDMMIGGQSSYTNAQATLSGGNANANFLLSGNYNRETTVFPGEWADRKAGVHFNVNSISPNQKFKVAFSGNYLSDVNKLPTVDFSQYITIAPNAPNMVNQDGSLNWIDYSDNPLKYKNILYTAETNNITGSSVLSYAILPGLELKTSFGFNSVLLDEKTESPTTAFNPNSGNITGSAQFNNNKLESWIVEPQLNYETRIGQGNLGVLLGGTIQRRSINGQIIYADGYSDNSMLGSLAGATSISKSPESVVESYRYASLFGRINYTFKDKYILNLTGRRDGSSRFGPGRQYGNFGAIGAGWIFSNEPFFKEFAPFINFGKLRLSYGTVGNEPASNYAFLELYNQTPDNPYGGGGGIYPTNLNAPDYRWELNKKFETGLELSLFESKLSISVSNYRNTSTNQLVNYPYASIVGFGSITANLPAVIENRGWEFSINSINLKNKNFQWSSAFNLAISRNRLTEFPLLESSSYSSLYIIGQPVNLRRIFASAGINQETGRYQFFDQNGSITATPESPADKISFVHTNPDYYGGIQNSLSYKGFSVDLFFQFVKQKGQNSLFVTTANPGRFNNFTKLANQPVWVLDRWRNEGTSSKIQKFSQNAQARESYNFAKESDLLYSDASFVRLKNASISYTLPFKVTKKISLQKIRVFAQGQNLLTFTKYQGTDPETQSINSLPPLRILTFGFQVTL